MKPLERRKLESEINFLLDLGASDGLIWLLQVNDLVAVVVVVVVVVVKRVFEGLKERSF